MALLGQKFHPFSRLLVRNCHLTLKKFMQHTHLLTDSKWRSISFHLGLQWGCPNRSHNKYCEVEMSLHLVGSFSNLQRGWRFFSCVSIICISFLRKCYAFGFQSIHSCPQRQNKEGERGHGDTTGHYGRTPVRRQMWMIQRFSPSTNLWVYN